VTRAGISMQIVTGVGQTLALRPHVVVRIENGKFGLDDVFDDLVEPLLGSWS
jgi:hypothetical protein